MSTKSTTPGEPDTAASLESRRAPAAANVGRTSPDEPVAEEGEGDVLDLPDLGAFSAESARPTPLDDIAEAEREKAPRD